MEAISQSKKERLAPAERFVAGANLQDRGVLRLSPDMSFTSSRCRLKQSGHCNVLRRTMLNNGYK